jgi:hypothetical protein
LHNPFEKTIAGAIRLNHGFTGPAIRFSPVERVKGEFALPADKGKNWSRVRMVTLEEVPEQDLPIDADGWVNFKIENKKILTIEFLP